MTNRFPYKFEPVSILTSTGQATIFRARSNQFSRFLNAQKLKTDHYLNQI